MTLYDETRASIGVDTGPGRMFTEMEPQRVGLVYELDVLGETLESMEKQIAVLQQKLNPITMTQNWDRAESGEAASSGLKEDIPEYSDSNAVISVRAIQTRMRIFISRLAALEKAVQL